mgnify:CR=1 FL=1
MAEQEDACKSGANTSRASSLLRCLKSLVEAVTGPWTWRNLGGWLGIIAAILFIKGCVVDQYTIPSGSMEPTLTGDPRFFRGDRVLVNKWLFGPRIPFTTARLWKWGGPRRWDIVVFRAVDPNAEHPILIKRVVGLPGEQVRINEGKIVINGEVVAPPEPLEDVLAYTDEVTLDALEQKKQLLFLAKKNQPLPSLNPQHPQVKTLYAEMQRLHDAVRDVTLDELNDEDVEALCNDVNPVALQLLDGFFSLVRPQMRYGVSDAPEFSVIPEDHYFLLGDNSAHSLDGRMYGWVPHNHLYGRAFAVWWPWSRRQDFTGFSQTWWGRTLLYGLPLSFVGLEFFLALRRKSRV